MKQFSDLTKSLNESTKGKKIKKVKNEHLGYVPDEVVIAVANALGLEFMPYKEIKRLRTKEECTYNMVDFEELKKGLTVELEHIDVTGGDWILTAKIAMAHLRESPVYYTELEKMEKKFEKK